VPKERAGAGEWFRRCPEAARHGHNYDVAAYIWPSYHPDPRARIFWPDGIGEWQTVISNAPKFPAMPSRGSRCGVLQRGRPLRHGDADRGRHRPWVNVFIYDWYWYDGLPYLDGCLNDGS